MTCLPEPFYKDELVTLYNADFLSIATHLPEVEACVTDPPYGETSLEWDHWPENWPLQVRADSLWCFGSLRMFTEKWNEFSKWKLAQDVIWEKHNGSSMHPDRFRRVHEMVVHFYDAKKKWRDIYRNPLVILDAEKKTIKRLQRPAHWNGIKSSVYVSQRGGARLMRSVIFEKNCHGHAVHPTQKPVNLVQNFIRYSCYQFGTVLDPFAGSGTTLLAAKTCGRKAIGVEKNIEYCKAAARRLSQEVMVFRDLRDLRGLRETSSC